jgi:hypothetical protein
MTSKLGRSLNDFAPKGFLATRGVGVSKLALEAQELAATADEREGNLLQISIRSRKEMKYSPAGICSSEHDTDDISWTPHHQIDSDGRGPSPCA